MHSNQLMHLEFQNITSLLSQNGFSVRIIKNQIRKFLDNKHKIVQNKFCKKLSTNFICDTFCYIKNI